MAKLNGAEIVVECLKEQGVDTVFGYPGDAILNIYDALYRHQGEIRHVLTSQVKSAAHAADGYARATGRVGVCLAASGPGAADMVSGIATAYMDSSPVVAISCNVSQPILGKDSFQELDIAGISMPVTKYNFIVREVEMLAPVMRRAFQIAKSGRPGPVLIDMTKDVTEALTEYVTETPAPVKAFTERISDEDLDAAISMIHSSEKPCIIAGGGVIQAGAAEDLGIFAHKLQAPVCCTLMGQGAISQKDELYVGMVGMHGTKAANLCVSECDLLIAVGVRFSERVTGKIEKFAPEAKILHIDVDEAEINKNVRADAGIAGDARVVLRRLNVRLNPQNHEEWFAHAERLTDMYPMSYDKGRLSGPEIIEILDRESPEDTIIVTESGQHQMWAAQYYRFTEARSFLSPGGLGTMGFGLGAAIGAQIAKPDHVVVNVAGDACFRMNMGELATVSREGLPLVELIINNRGLGMLRQWQNFFYGKRCSETELNDQPDYCRIAEAMGIAACRVTTAEELETALREAFSKRKPLLIEAWIDPEDRVFPMCPPGRALEESFDASDLRL